MVPVGGLKNALESATKHLRDIIALHRCGGRTAPHPPPYYYKFKKEFDATCGYPGEGPFDLKAGIDVVARWIQPDFFAVVRVKKRLQKVRARIAANRRVQHDHFRELRAHRAHKRQLQKEMQMTVGYYRFLAQRLTRSTPRALRLAAETLGHAERHEAFLHCKGYALLIRESMRNIRQCRWRFKSCDWRHKLILSQAHLLEFQAHYCRERGCRRITAPLGPTPKRCVRKQKTGSAKLGRALERRHTTSALQPRQWTRTERRGGSPRWVRCRATASCSFASWQLLALLKEPAMDE